MSNQLESSAEKKVPSKGKRYSEEERNHHLEGWKKSGLSLSQYCSEAKITISSLSKWIRSQNKSKEDFKRITLSSTSFYSSHNMIEIIIDNRIKIRLPNTTDPSMTVNIARSLIQCS